MTDKRGCVVALGTFDGLHKGHLAVLSTALKFSDLTPVAVTFSEPPKRSTDESVGMLMTTADKNAQLQKMGFKVKELNYAEVKNLTAEQHLDALFNEFDIKAAVCGFDHRFGKNALGNAATLTAYCHSHGAEAVICPALSVSGQEVSSSFIRELLAMGNIGLANLLLGRRFSFESVVCHGEQRGRTLGFPTINQQLDAQLVVPKFGVYATVVTVDGKQYAGVTNIGIKPTFKLEKPQSETYICDFSGDAYGKLVKIELLKFLREEKQFETVDMLKEAISNDVETAMSEFQNLISQNI